MNFKLKLTDSQNLLLQGLLSILSGAVLAFLTGFVQFLTEHGAMTFTTIGTALSLGVGAFLFYFGTALKNYIPAHAQEEVQAGKDAQAQFQAWQASLFVQGTQPPPSNVPSSPSRATPPARPLPAPAQLQQAPPPANAFPPNPVTMLASFATQPQQSVQQVPFSPISDDTLTRAQVAASRNGV